MKRAVKIYWTDVRICGIIKGSNADYSVFALV